MDDETTQAQTEWPAERIAELLSTTELAAGHHTGGGQACAMDLIGMATEGIWTDTPECVHAILAQTAHRINDDPDTSPGERRTIVVEAGPLLIGTSGVENTPWAVLVAHRAGYTAAGLVAALTHTTRNANLRGANLSGADLRGADLRGADLGDANLRGAKNLGEAHNVPADALEAWKAGQVPPAR